MQTKIHVMEEAGIQTGPKRVDARETVFEDRKKLAKCEGQLKPNGRNHQTAEPWPVGDFPMGDAEVVGNPVKGRIGCHQSNMLSPDLPVLRANAHAFPLALPE